MNCSCLVAEVRFTENNTGEERTECKGHAEEFRRAIGDAERKGQDGEGKQLAGFSSGDQLQNPRDNSRSDQKDERNECDQFAQRKSKCQSDALDGGYSDVGVCDASDCGQAYKDEDHYEILDHEPAYGNAAIHRVQLIAFFQGAQEHNCAGA